MAEDQNHPLSDAEQRSRDLKIFGDLVRSKRKQLGWSQSDLAKEAYGNETRKGDISEIENAKNTNFEFITILNIFRALKLPLTSVPSTLININPSDFEKYTPDIDISSEIRLFLRLLHNEGSNYISLLNDKVDKTESALIRVEHGDYCREDIDDIITFQLNLLIYFDTNAYIGAPKRKADIICSFISDNLAKVTGHGEKLNGVLELDDVIIGNFEILREMINEFLEDKEVADIASRCLSDLSNVIDTAIINNCVNITEINRRAETVRIRVRERFGRGFRIIAGALRKNIEDAPPRTIFVDDLDEGPEMVTIKLGHFDMGGSDGEPERFAGSDPNLVEWEKPRHRVRIARKFALSRYAITLNEYKVFCKATKRDLPLGDDWGNGGLPVVNVSWTDAKAYCAWLSSVLSATYRLPSEAEWEFACRAGKDTPFTFGDALSASDAHFNSSEVDARLEKDQASTQVRPGQPAPVDHTRYKPNEFGLYQMHGNVWEWCEDSFIPHYRNHPGQQPREANDDVAEKVARGGSWNDPMRLLRSAKRMGISKEVCQPNIGFRVARSII